MKRLFIALLLTFCALPAVLRALQEAPTFRLEITGVNASELPTATITTNVYDALGQPVGGLTAENFSIVGELADVAEIVRVENITDDNLPFATVLVIDVSDSMAGVPLASAQDAARAFIASIGENDPVALVTFGSRVRVVQDYTTDKAVLLAAIDALRWNGQTALYQGAYEGIDLAASSPTPRRAVVLLGDGVEYGGMSDVLPNEVNELALTRGVPVYTIGLGYGADRTFLQQLSSLTNARFYESPDPEQLVEIYSELAALLRSQYVITLAADLPLDGTEYDLGLQVVSEADTAQANAVLRAPIPVPIVQLSTLADASLDTPITVTATVLADDPLSGVIFMVGDQMLALSEAPYTYTIDPAALPPGDYTLMVEAIDVDSDRGTAQADFTVAALPSRAVIEPDLSTLGALREPVTVTVSAAGQTAAASLNYNVVGAASAPDEFVPVDADNTFTLDPQTLAAGDNQLIIEVTNESGITSTTAFPFSVAPLPPILMLNGLQDGQIIDSPVTFEVNASGQSGTLDMNATIGSDLVLPVQVEPGNYASSAIFTIDPFEIEPGAQPVTFTAVDENGQTGTQTVNLIISALPPSIVVSGLSDGDVLEADTRVDLSFVSQTPVTRVTLALDDVELVQQSAEPYGTTLSIEALAPGEHTLTITAQTISSQQSAVDIRFIIAEGPSLTATALAPTLTPTPTETPDAGATRTQQAAISSARTSTAEAIILQAEAEEAIQQQTAAANGTGTAVRTTSTAVALATADAVLQATSESASFATQNAESSATRSARSTQSANATGTVNAQATTQARLTATAEAQATLDSATILNAHMTATQELIATATSNARATSQAAAQQEAQQSTRSAMATANMQARQNATQTVDARATRTAEAAATRTANENATQQAATLTREAQSTVLAENNLTSTAVAELGATQTAVAEVSATSIARSTERFIETATANQQATIDTQLAAVGATQTPTTPAETEESDITAVAQGAGTTTPRPTPLPQPTLTLIEAENPPSTGEITPLVLIGIVLLIVLLIIVYLVLTSGRRKRRR